MGRGQKMTEPMSIRRAARILLLLAMGALVLSCSKNNGQLEMQPLSMEELSPRVEWALVSDPYVACRKEAGYESETVASFRKGEIYEVKGNRMIRIDDTTEKWYALGDGWVPSGAVQVYSNRLRAESARKSLR